MSEPGTDHDELPALVKLAEAHLEKREGDAAAAILRRAVEQRPRDAELWNLLGNASSMSGLAAEAARAYERSIELDPRSHKPLANLANQRLRAGDAAGAIELYERALPLCPGNLRVLKNYVAALSTVGRVETAIDALQRFIEGTPSRAAFDALADVLSGSGNEEGAAKARELGRLADIAASVEGPVSLANVERRAFWTELVPGMSIERTEVPAPLPIPGLAELPARLRREGYIQVADVIPPDRIAKLRACIETLHARGIPLPFAFVFDEPWAIFQSLRAYLELVMGAGFMGLPAFWIWLVPPSDEASGWGPHRDRLWCTLDEDNSPHALTIWIPLTDATPLNGCMYVLPAHHDERFVRRVFDGPDANTVLEPQKIRALPATAGSLLSWNQALLHWGSHASRMGKEPRISMAFEFQRADVPVIKGPLVPFDAMPTFERRLGLIGKQIVQYRHMYPLPPELAATAVLLELRFGGEVSGG